MLKVDAKATKAITPQGKKQFGAQYRRLGQEHECGPGKMTRTTHSCSADDHIGLNKTKYGVVHCKLVNVTFNSNVTIHMSPIGHFEVEEIALTRISV